MKSYLTVIYKLISFQYTHSLFLIQIINHCQSRQVLLKFVLVGDAETGKTSIVNKFLSNTFNEEYIATKCNKLYEYDTNCEEIIIDDDKTNKKYIIQLQLWDTKGKLPPNININKLSTDIPTKHPKSKHNDNHDININNEYGQNEKEIKDTKEENRKEHRHNNNECHSQNQMYIDYRKTHSNIVEQHQNNFRQPLLYPLSKYSNLHSTPIANNYHTEHNELGIAAILDELDAMEDLHNDDIHDNEDKKEIEIGIEEEKMPMITMEAQIIKQSIDKPPTKRRKRHKHRNMNMNMNGNTNLNNIELSTSDSNDNNDFLGMDGTKSNQDIINDTDFKMDENGDKINGNVNKTNVKYEQDINAMTNNINSINLQRYEDKENIDYNNGNTKHIDLKHISSTLNSQILSTTAAIKAATSTLKTDETQGNVECDIDSRNGYSSESPNTIKTNLSSDERLSDSRNIDEIIAEDSKHNDDMVFNENMFEGLDALILVYDITNLSTFNNLNGWISLFTEYCIDGEDVPILVLGNKKDLKNNRKIEHKQGRKFTHKLSNPHKLFYEVSAKENDPGNTLKDIFTELARKCINREASVLDLMSGDSIASIADCMNRTRYVNSNNDSRRRNEYSVKTCTQSICGSNKNSNQNDQNMEFCVVL